MKGTKELEGYKEYLFQKELSEGTIKIYMRQAIRLLDYFGDGEITKKQMIAYKKYLQSQKYKIATLNLHIIAANSYLKYIGYENCVIKTERVQKKRCLENILSMKEYRCILAYAKKSGREKYYFIMKVLAFTGIRVSELSFLTVESLVAGKFIVDNKGKIREVYFPKGLAADLKNYCNENNIQTGAIFKGNKQTPISRNAVYQMLVYLADMAGVEKEKAHPHSFRHLFAITYMEHYANLTELADILGHSSLETTRIYTTATAEERRNRLEGLDF